MYFTLLDLNGPRNTEPKKVLVWSRMLMVNPFHNIISRTDISCSQTGAIADHMLVSQPLKSVNKSQQFPYWWFSRSSICSVYCVSVRVREHHQTCSPVAETLSVDQLHQDVVWEEGGLRQAPCDESRGQVPHSQLQAWKVGLGDEGRHRLLDLLLRARLEDQNVLREPLLTQDFH